MKEHSISTVLWEESRRTSKLNVTVQLQTGVGGNEPVLCEGREELLLAGASLY